jgi:8-oxo-dGTP pyrophosphatase MutT (NUDIX family)
MTASCGPRRSNSSCESIAFEMTATHSLALPRSAGIVVVRRSTEGEWVCLLLRAYRDWDFPKGGIDAGESALGAAIRETAEEASMANLKFEWGDAYCDTARYSGGKIARYFIAQTSSESVKLGINPALGRPEHHEFRWATIEQARILVRPRLHPIIDWACTLLATEADSGLASTPDKRRAGDQQPTK